MSRSRLHQLRRQRRLFLETLESRRLLDASAGAVLGWLPDGTSGNGASDVAIAPTNSPDTSAEHTVISRFASDQELKDFLLADARERYQVLFGQPALCPVPWINVRDDGMPYLAVDAATGTADHSDTNVQVAGVDESDIWKTDGRYLYISGEQRITIVDTAGPDGLTVASRLQLDSQPLAMYVSDGRLAVVAMDWQPLWDVMPLAVDGDRKSVV